MAGVIAAGDVRAVKALIEGLAIHYFDPALAHGDAAMIDLFPRHGLGKDTLSKGVAEMLPFVKTSPSLDLMRALLDKGKAALHADPALTYALKASRDVITKCCHVIGSGTLDLLDTSFWSRRRTGCSKANGVR